MNTTIISQHKSSAYPFLHENTQVNDGRHDDSKQAFERAPLVSNRRRNTGNGVIAFPKANKSNKQHTKGWTCNLSKRYAFSQHRKEQLNIKTNEQYTQFDIMCRLLKANTCSVIYFDEQLSDSQLTYIREHHSNTRTELLHAKIAFMFSKTITPLYA